MDRGEEANSDDVLYRLALALIELIDRRVDVELEHPGGGGALALHGTLLRAFEPPFNPGAPTLSIAIGPHCIGIRVTEVTEIALRRRHGELLGLHILLAGDDALHIKALRSGVD